MKLHLPKRLLTALLAAFTAITLTAAPAWGATSVVNKYDANGDLIDTNDTSTEVARTEIVYTATATETAANPSQTVQLIGDSEGNNSFNPSAYIGEETDSSKLIIEGNGKGVITNNTTNGGFGGRVQFIAPTTDEYCKDITLSKGIEGNITNIQGKSDIELTVNNASIFGNTTDYALTLNIGADGVRFNGGNATDLYTWTGSVKGTGDFVMYVGANGTRFVITGDTSSYSGTWRSSKDRTFEFGNGNACNGGIVGGNVETTSANCGGVKYNFSGAYEIAGTISTTSVEVVQGQATFKQTVDTTGSMTLGEGTSVTLEATSNIASMVMSKGASLSVTGGITTVSSALNVTGTDVQLGQSGEGVILLQGNVNVAQNASAEMQGAISLCHTITNDGSLTLNGTVNIATAITGNGTVEVGGLLTMADYNELYNFSYTYSNSDGGTNSGLRTGYTGYFSQGELTVGETGCLAIANSADASITDAGYVTGTIQQGDGIYYVNEALTYNAATMAADAVTSILVSSTGTLNVAGSSVGKSLSNAGTVNYSMDGGSVNVNSLFQTNTGVVKVDMNASSAETLTGTASLSADLGAGTGTVSVENAASFTNAGYKINSQKLVLNNVENATIGGSSDRRISTSLELIQSNLTITRGDAFDYDDSSVLTFKIGAESILDLGSYRQSIRSNHIIEMAGGTLKGAGAHHSDSGYVYGIDFYDGGRFNTSADSRIETNVGAHLSNKNIQFDVNTGKTLVMTGSLVGLGTFSKTAGGTMEYSGAGFAQSMTITGGTFTYAVDEDRTMNGRLNGGTLKQSGTGVLTFNASTSEAGRGTVNVAAGGVAYNLGGRNTDVITLTGISGTTFTKKGAGTLQVNTSGYAGDIEVNEGTLMLNAKRESNAALRVGNGATLDVNGFAGYYNLTLAGGALLTNNVESNNADNLGTGKMQMHTITISDGNATVSGRSDFGMIGSGYAQTSLYLGGNTLVKTGDNTFYMYNTYVKSEGTIQIDGGTVESNNRDNKTDLSAASVVVNADGEFKVTGNSQTIKELTLNGGGVSVASGKSLTATGNVALNGGSVDGDLTAGSITVQEGTNASVSGALTLNQASVIDGTLTVGSLTTKHTQTVNGTLILNSALNLSSGTAYLTPSNEDAVTYQGSEVEGNGYKLATFDVITGNVRYGNGFIATLSGTELSVVTGDETPTATDYFTKTSTGLTLTIGSSSGIYYVNNSETLAYVTAGAYYVAEGATLTFSGTQAQDAILTKPIYGTGRVEVTFNTSNHNESVQFGSGFNGTVRVDGYMKLAAFSLGADAVLALGSGQIWSPSTCTFANKIVFEGSQNDFSIIGQSLILNGEVTGSGLTSSLDAGATLTLSNAANDLDFLKIASGSASIGGGEYDCLQVTTGRAVNLTGGNIGHLMAEGGTVNLSGSATIDGSGTTGNYRVAGLYINGSVVNVGNGTDAYTLVVPRVEAANGAAATLNVKQGATLVVTGSDVAGSASSSENAYWKTGFVLGEWQSDATMNVNGTLLVQNAHIAHGGRKGVINIENGAVVAAQGIHGASNQGEPDASGSIDLNLKDGGKLILGAGGIDAQNLTSSLGNGTIGISADSVTIADNLTLSSTAGTIFDTQKYVWSGEGASLAISRGESGGSLTISGSLTGDGGLIKNGAGTLILTGENTYTGDTTVNGGVLEVAAGGSLGTGGVVSVASGAELKFSNTTDREVASAISGAGTLTKVGSGKLTLSGAVGTEESHLSSVTISNGELAIQGNAYISSLALTGNAANADLRVVSGATLNAGTILSKENISENRDIFVESGATMTVDNLHVAYKMGQIDVDGTLNVGTLKLAMNQTNDDMVIGDGTLSVQTLNVYNQTKTAISTETLSVGEGGLNITGNSSILKLYSATTTVAGATAVGTNQLFFESGNAELNGAVTSNGTTTVNGGTVSMGSTFDNQSSGVFTAAAGVTAVAGAVTNAGTFNVNGGEVDMESTLTNNSGAELNVTAGSVTVTGAVTNAGTFTVNGGSVTLAGGVSGAGSVELNSGSLTLGANSEIGRFVYNEGTLSHSGLTIGDAIFSGGTLENSGNLTLNGTLTVTSTLGLTLSGEATYSGGAVDGNGYANATYQVITGGNITYGTGEDGFTFKWGEEVLDVLDGVAPQAGDSAYATKTENALTLTVAGNSGIFYVNTGTETLAVDKADSYYVKSGARLEFIQEASNRVIEKEINGDGTVAVAFGESDFNGALNFGEGFNGVAEVSGKMNLQNTRLGTNATLKLGNAQISNSAATTYAGNIELTGTAVDSVTIAGSALTLNGAVTGTNLSTGADLTLTNAANNLGQLRITAGTTTIRAAGGTYGTLSLTGGTLNINESNFNVTGGIKQTDGTVNFYSGTVNLAGESSFTKLDMAGGDDRSGHLILQEGAKMTSTGSFWLASSAKVTLLNGATLTRDGITLTGKGDTSVLKENGNKGNMVSFSSSDHQVTDMAVSVSSGSETILGLKLITSDVTNSGTGKLIISDGAHTINTLHAKSGDIEFSSQSSPTVATAKVEEGKTLTLNGGASINNIEAAKGTVALASGKTLTLNGSASIGKMDAANGKVVQALGSTISLADKSQNTIGTLTATQSEFYVGEGAAVTINGGLNLYEKDDRGIGSTVYLAADSVMRVELNGSGDDGRFSMNDDSAVELEAGAKFYLGDILNVTGMKHDGEQKSTINSTGWMVYSNEKENVVMNNAAVQYTKNGDTEFKNRLTNSSLEIATQGSYVTTITNASNTITELSLTGGNAKLSQSMTVQSISAKEGKVVTVSNGKTISMAGGVNIGTNEGDATMTAKTDTALLQMQENASFTIADMELSNVNIEAANASDRVNLSGLSASDVQLTKGEFHMLDKAQPQVGIGGSAINLIEGGPTGLQFSTSLLNGMTLGADASMVVDLGDLSGFTGMDSGKPTFSITLEGFRISDYLAENPGIYFAADSWLGQLLVAQGAWQYVKGDTLEAGTQATAGTGSGVSVSYNPTSVGVGTVITITGLQVPEPASATLGLAALMMLCARRRRRA